MHVLLLLCLWSFFEEASSLAWIVFTSKIEAVNRLTAIDSTGNEYEAAPIREMEGGGGVCVRASMCVWTRARTSKCHCAHIELDNQD